MGAKPTRSARHGPNLTHLPDGNARKVDAGITPAQVAADISTSLAKKAISATVNGRHWDLQWPIEADAEIAIHTMKDEPQALELIRHDLAHIMARAVQEIWPGTKVTIGPVIENGWYYDFDRDEPFTPEDLGAIEKKMKEIINRRDPVTTEIWERAARSSITRPTTSPTRSSWSRRSPATSPCACTGTAIGRISAAARTCSTPARCPATPSS